MSDKREVGMMVWYCPPYGGTPSQITITKVLQRQVVCSDGNKYNFAPGDTWGMKYGGGSMVKHGMITTECQQSRIAEIADREKRIALRTRLDTLMAIPRATEKLEELIAFLEAQNVQN